jgi:hypothetical protein
MQATWLTKYSSIRATLLRDRVCSYTLSSAFTLTSRLFIFLLIVILVGVTLVVAWPIIFIGAMILALLKGIDAWKRPPARGLTNDLVISSKAVGRSSAEAVS